jgi:iron complex outermembrane receptor protein
VTQNIGKASISGIELELQAAPGRGWLIEASLAKLDASYDIIDTSITLISKNNEFERVPETTAALGVSKETSLRSGASLTGRLDWGYRSETYNDAYNSEILKTDAFGLLDVSLSWVNADSDLKVVLSGKNLGDEKFMVTGVYGTAFQSYEAMYDRGRQWRLEVKKDF